MSNVVFLAPQVDAVTPTTMYGSGHQMNLTDESLCALWNNQGKVAYLGALIRGISVQPIAATTATINWFVDVPCTAMKVDYGTTTAYGSSQTASPAAGVGAVTAALTLLTTATTYHYRISVTNGSNVTMTPDLTFRTA